MSASQLPQAPGAGAAKVCGILAIVCALTCVGIPLAIILGIVALVQQAKAKRTAKADPQAYAPVPSTGLVTGIIGLVLPVLMLPFVGIVSAIAIPALLSQREQARSMAIQHNLDLVQARAEAAVFAWQARNPGQPAAADVIIQDLLKDPEVSALKNPVDPKAPAIQAGRVGALGTILVYADREEEGGVTTWSIRFQAHVRRGSGEKVLERQVVTHTQEHVRGHTEDGWEVVNPPVEPPAPHN
ncbi:DUF4190 domain-containing protein [Geothrix campi]|uniref:DUF4190 domain-containing protein n=1 Tax=Geothrix campi TaxID=2966450 RepID=UPI002149458A|nr:DUF4190 domain-containing protein [Geothrix sp. SG10]